MSCATKVFKPTWHTIARMQQFLSLRQFSYGAISSAVARRNQLFNQEQKHQLDAVGRIEKIEVRYLGLPEDVTLVMNRSLSTPYNCAQHLSEGHCKRSVLALIDGNIPWDIHRPLQESCTLQLLNFTMGDPHLVNKAFWRTCSFMLGAVLQNCFKEEADLQLHSFPGPNIKTGSFVYDIVLGAQTWEPTKNELRTLSAEMTKLAAKDLKIERLEVNETLALEMFKDVRYKSEQIPNISEQNEGRVTLYRMGTHIDISRGPLVGSSHFLGKCSITATHKIANNTDKDAFYRIQGVGLPSGIILNHFAYGMLETRSRKLNPARLPTEPFEESQRQLV